MLHRVFFADNLPVLQSLPAESVDLIYIDPPFNTGRVQARTQILMRYSHRTQFRNAT
jgi:site-specific DNA-methyltransferase (adenine-specific)